MLTTYGRITNADGSRTWVEVTSTPDGYDDPVWLTTLAQTLQLNLGESPFFSNYGIPGKESIVQQIFPDFFVARTQQQFAPYFASLLISRVSNSPPTYLVNVTTHQGLKYNFNVKVPT